MGKGVLDVVMWIIIGSLIVLIIMNPSGFAQDVGAVGGAVQGESSVLTGSGYKKAK
jgi:hypothetical protein